MTARERSLVRRRSMKQPMRQADNPRIEKIVGEPRSPHLSYSVAANSEQSQGSRLPKASATDKPHDREQNHRRLGRARSS
jgi:hypothetical protein